MKPTARAERQIKKMCRIPATRSLIACSLTAFSLMACSVVVCSAGQVRPAKPTSNRAAKPATNQAPSKLGVSELGVTGNKTLAKGQILAAAGLKIGDPVSTEALETARERLVATGFFDSVGYRYDPDATGKGYRVVFAVDEIQQVYPYRFESLQMEDAKLRAHLQNTQIIFPDKLPGTELTVARWAKSIEGLLSTQGNLKQDIVGRLSPLPGGGLEIVFRPAKLPAIAEVDFEGNALINTKKLREAVVGPAIGAIYTEPKLREILDVSIRPLYEEVGRLRVQFPKIEAAPAKDVNGLAIRVRVAEGEEFKLRSVGLAKPEAGKQDPEQTALSPAVLKEGKFALDEVANMTKVKEGVSAVEQSLRRKGYLEVKTTTTRALDDAAKALDVKVDIDPGPRFTFRKLTIEGLDIETEPHIRKLWSMKLGQPFNSEYPDYFLAKLREDDLFDNLGRTKSVVAPDPGNGGVDVTLVFEGEKKPKKPTFP